VDQEHALLVRGHRVMMKAAHEVSVHNVEERTARLIDAVAMRERKSEAHHGGTGRVEHAAIAKAVNREESLVGIADEGKRERRRPEIAARALQEIRRNLDDLGLGALEILIIATDPVRVDSTERAREPAREPDDDVAPLAVRREIDHGSPDRWE